MKHRPRRPLLLPSLFSLLVALGLSGCSEVLPDGTACVSDTECATGRCVEGVCAPAGGDECTEECCEDTDCPVTQVCRLNRCVDRDEPDGGIPGQREPDIEVSPLSLDFGGVQVGAEIVREITVRNVGNDQLRVTDVQLDGLAMASGDFSFDASEATGGDILQNGSAIIRVTYRPSDAQEDSGNLIISSNDPDEALIQIALSSELKGEAAVALVDDLTGACDELANNVDPLTEVQTLDFGDVAIGGSSTRTVFLINQGTENVALAVTELRMAPADPPGLSLLAEPAPGVMQSLFLPVLRNFDCTDDSEPPAGWSRVTVTFAPVDDSPVEAELVVVSTDQEIPELRIPVSGSGVRSDLIVSPQPIDFGTVFFGQSAGQELTLENQGTLFVDITRFEIVPEVPVPDMPPLVMPFLIGEDNPLAPLPFSIDAGAREVVPLLYVPPELGEHDAVLIVESSDAARPRIEILLMGRSIDPPAIAANPAAMDFPITQIGLQSELMLIISNEGGSELVVEPITIEGVSSAFHVADPQVPDVPSAGSHVVNVVFGPASTGQHAAVLRIRSNDPAIGELDVPLNGVGSRPRLSAEPETLDFGTHVRGVPVQGETVTLRNTGEGPLEIQEIVLRDGVRFSVGSQPELPHVLEAGEVTEVDLVFTPGAGAARDSLVVRHDVHDQAEVQVPLTGEGRGCPDGFNDIDEDPNDCEYTCPVFPTGPELCNGEDDDCDGEVDETFNVGGPCDGAGDCGVGFFECADELTARCSTEPGGSNDESGDEICDGADNNCDGATDEGFSINAPCDGRGECGIGAIECAGPDATRCSTDPGGSRDQSQPELCDGLDNNCDGVPDDGFGIASACDGEGECGAGAVECAGPNATRCSTEPGGSRDQSQPELCDGLDNNCNGESDDGFAIGSACDGEGECGAGVVECENANETRCSTEPGGSAEEIADEVCDGLDNDCDGEADEGFEIGTPCDGEGECGAGLRECSGPLTTRCSSDAGGSADESSAELCDGLDNDCDGANDNGFGLGEDCDGVGECGAGVVECADANSTHCSTDAGASADESQAETCDGLDNDCDGANDNGFDLGRPCIGEGTCGTGQTECFGPDSVGCSVDPGGSADAAVAEVCDGRDNDCDGVVDEDFGLGEACTGEGVCGAGTVECAGPDGTRCSTMPGGSEDGSSAEVCDGQDNDCDGARDNGFEIGTACSVQGECGDGVIECESASTTRCSVAPGASNDGSTAEICDGLDNDCDGRPDEGFGIGQPCSAEGACGDGVFECASTQSVRCSTAPGSSNDGSSEEICDGIDNDCDGETDEGFGVGAACDGIGACGAGVRECAGPSTTRCSTDAGGSADQSREERCDGRDNDCDGDDDEDFRVGAACDGEGECAAGVIECADLENTRCSSDAGGSADGSGPELCDGLDNDCDGVTDNGFGIGGDCDGVGECGAGVVECADENNTRCSTDAGGSADESAAEICDTLDNDCNGVADDGYGTGVPCEGAGDCGQGVIECAGPDATQCSTDPGGSDAGGSDEICDGRDNDCDGEVDEGFGIGTACDGVGECGAGALECADATSTRCSTDVGGSADESSVELCDGLDNDCDGSDDDGWNLGTACDGVGDCGAGLLECADASNTRCSTDAGGSADESVLEICDGGDNNCDGRIDEGFGIDGACEGEGECGPGLVECAGPNATRCSTEAGGSADESAPEICDGLDNNCDGDDDEGFFVGSPCDGVGACGSGLRECSGPTQTRCSTDTGGSADQSRNELCNGADDDCDGEADEDFALGSECDGRGACGIGFVECRTTTTTRCSTDRGGSEAENEAEICDGQDNDCDGTVDEGFGIGLACDGRGECGAGLRECATASTTRCSSDVGGSADQSAVETCDGLDNDCDGQFDEGFGIGNLCDGVGDCGPGIRECATATTTRCSTDAGGTEDGSQAETCDSADNDCDGAVDEDFGIGNACDGVGECGAGTLECRGLNATRCSTDRGGSEDQAGNEICDGLDNDCDGADDDGFAVGSACDALGECGVGVIECATALETRCSTGVGGSSAEVAEEICDGLDNDCDGEIDEGFSIGVACDGVGECGAGVVECSGPNATRCSTDVGGTRDQSVAEVCDGLDNDCDGSNDNTWNIGTPCIGTGACGNGTLECAGLNATRCSTDPGGSQFSNTDEICDGVDNDCDGQIDEGFNIGVACDGVGECGAGTVECADANTTRCSTDAGGSASEAAAEICDGLDNNCDGAADEGFSIGAACDGVGECGAGIVECADADTTRCSTDAGGSATEAVAEACDGLDNDCDGDADNGWNIGSACDGVGACGAGSLECATVSSTRCSTDAGGSGDESEAEVCDSIDNNCDGNVDEGFSIGTACDGVGECAAGTVECAGPTSTRCTSDAGGSADESAPEVCDGLDNNCDGVADDGFNIGSACDGVGACGAGSVECADANTTRCSTDAGGSGDESSAEICDGADNDCDGDADEGFSIGEVCDGVGECGAGLIECADANTTRCSTDAGGSGDQSAAELCDGLDNDCDGDPDNGFAIGDACDGVGSCGNGTIECKDLNSTHCSTDIGASADESVAETCNGQDDDCDGEADEDFPLGDACDGVGECGAGVFECDGAGATRCSTDAGASADQSAAELCDGLDNDCDGSDDEGFAIGDACDGVGECGAGVVECADTDSTRCSTDAGGSADESAAELCDGLDNNCDGAADDGFSIGDVCDGVGSCGAGRVECRDLNTTHCSTDAGGSEDGSGAESCNGQDDDCDGSVDEDFQVGEACDGVGACGGGTFECKDANSAHCSTDSGASGDQSSPELCDGIDNDCDGETDEDFFVGQNCDGVGSCGAGTLECATLTTTRCTTDAGGSADESTAESCNGEDDDCDGNVDEDFSVGNACNGTGECGPGIVECASLSTTRCSTDAGGSADESAAEICDGLDNDCDGSNDEGFNIGAACTGVGVCGAGLRECAGPNATRCSTMPGGSEDLSGAELCDGLDNNCDGTRDEGWSLGEACDGRGECGVGIRECAGLNATRCSTDRNGTEDQSSPELCDGLDNDCDGNDDEGFGLGLPCNGEGECGAGTFECAGPNTTRCSTDPGGSLDESVAETCDGLDNDCDGQADDGFGIGTPCDGVGECGSGLRECAGANITRCSTDAGGTADQSDAETCDSRDNDCDGDIDEDFNVGDACTGVGECGAGVIECATNATTRCSSMPGGSGDQSNGELCDALDNDCDGQADETFDLGEACGIGGCAGGVKECLPDGSGTRCDRMPGGSNDASVAELCDAADNDCDGDTDEVFAAGGTVTYTDVDGTTNLTLGQGCGAGACAGGTVVCGADQSSLTCTTLGNIAADVCDGTDNDCDGAVDEDYIAGGTVSYTDLDGSAGLVKGDACGTGACDGGSVVCGADQLSLTCTSLGSVSADVCDSVDNDCDGVTDEDFIAGGTVSYTDLDGTAGLVKNDGCGVGVCAGGQVACSADGSALTCTTLGNVSAELCDAADNDCDGVVDEEFLAGGSVTFTDLDGTVDLVLGSACGTGACDGGSVVCSADGQALTCDSHSAVAADVCDAIDNNCDGTTDEDYIAGGTVTLTDLDGTAGLIKGDGCGVGACVGGSVVCGADQLSLACSTGGNAAQDVCDSLDNDCDGATDEDYVAGGSVTFTDTDGTAGLVKGDGCGSGACSGGVVVCGADQLSLRCTTGGAGNSEICDGEDNDCDGTIDEDFIAGGTVTYTDLDGSAGLVKGDACGSGLCDGGSVICNGDGSGLTCSTAGNSVADTCDALDNDCDGLTDEEFLAGGTVSFTDLDGTAGLVKGDGCGVGACVGGTVECSGDGASLQCSSAGAAGADVCDGADNDCDGTADEDFLPGGSVSYTDLDGTANLGKGEGCGAGACAGGAVICGADQTSLTCSTVGNVTPDTCNELDDDCDGVIDEDYLPGGLVSYTDLDGTANLGKGEGCGAGDCSGGTVACGGDGTSLTCTTAGSASLDVCDGADNDCDGAADEDYSAGGSVTYTDLDGTTDLVLGQGCGSGACDGGAVVCGADQTSLTCSTAASASQDLCDGADNDCDGSTDEDFLTGGTVSFTDLDGTAGLVKGDGCGVGACNGGSVVCSGDGTALACSTAGSASNDLCDGLDNDCDGATDEDYSAGGSVTYTDLDGTADLVKGDGCGVGACGGGQVVCGADQVSLTCTTRGAVGADICDGIDNDCDGLTDEDFIAGGSVTFTDLNGTAGLVKGDGCGVGACGGGVVVCGADGVSLSCTTSGNAGNDVCDGVDNDCDGTVDEAYIAGGSVTFTDLDGTTDLVKGQGCGAGACAGGTVVCGLDQLSLACSTAGNASEDVCDGADNDCDGVADDDYVAGGTVSYTDLDGTAGLTLGVACGTGACDGGTVVCGADQRSLTCDTAGNASGDICDALDNDCDGDTDEAFVAGGSVTLTDLDGTGGLVKGDACGAGACVGGNVVCSADGTSLECNSHGSATNDICDGADNDCDGTADEDFIAGGSVTYTDLDGTTDLVKGAACGSGACAGGTVVCSADGSALDCTTAANSSEDVCDGTDNDCDGAADEDYSAGGSVTYTDLDGTAGLTLGVACGTGACDGGTVVCGADQRSLDCDTAGNAAADSCDGVDNDCDGTVDEAYIAGGSVTFTDLDGTADLVKGDGCGVGACNGGSVVCNAGGDGLECDSHGNVDTDVCDGADNDCDGTVDEAYIAGGSVTFTDLDGTAGLVKGNGCGAGACAGGTVICGADEVSLACSTAGNVSADTCDGTDNDCDGTIDEAYIAGGSVTFTDLNGTADLVKGDGCGVGACAGGSVVCNAGGDGLECDSHGSVAQDLCDGADNDCDGSTDEDYIAGGSVTFTDLDGTADLVKGSACGVGVCDGGSVVCSADGSALECDSHGNVTTDSCDGADNDCDGTTDEAYIAGGSVTLTDLDGTANLVKGDGCGVGACAGGSVVCNAGGDGLECDSHGSVSTDTCDGADNDCDGVTDDDYVDGTVTLTDLDGSSDLVKGDGCGVGACTGGTVVCNAGGDGLECNSHGSVAQDSCDGIDNDCDGGVDEDFIAGGSVTLTDLDGTAGLVKGNGCGVGACNGGTVVCSADGSALECSTHGSVAQDLCDGADNDCDGGVDEDYLAGGSVTFTDLNGAANLVKGNSCGVGACNGGTVVCSADGTALECNTHGSVSQDTCDGNDNDCDGVVDEDFIAGGSVTLTDLDGTANLVKGNPCGVGACVGGTVACNAGGDGLICTTHGASAQDVCDGADNDCDGTADEDYLAGGSVTYTDLDGTANLVKGNACGTGACNGGTVICGADQLSLACTTQGNASADTCDGVDNNCNGTVDEDYIAGGSVTLTDLNGTAGLVKGDGCGVGACTGGTVVCNGAGTGLACDSHGSASADVCDGADNNCDGDIDEDYVAGGSVTFTDLDGTANLVKGSGCGVGACTGGTVVCNGAGTGLECNSHGSVSADTCDGADNNCNGVIDEDYIAGGSVTLTDLDGTAGLVKGSGCGVGSCAGGTVVCNAGGDGLECNSHSNVATDTCDGVDNNCDGTVDNDYVDGTVTLTDLDGTAGLVKGNGCGVGACAGGTVVCNAGGNGLECNSHGSVSADTCDGADNNCNGTIDENFIAGGSVTLTDLDGTTGLVKGNSCGVGACNGGSVVCSADGTALECNTHGNASADTCDGADNNCDGNVDEEFLPGGSVTLTDLNGTTGLTKGGNCGVGACAGGTVVCSGDGSALECNTHGNAATDTCDGNDNNCNGVVDENFIAGGTVTLTDLNGTTGLVKGNACGVGACAGGTVICNAGGDGLQCTTHSAASADVCDSADNNCNGVVDEDYIAGGSVTYTDPDGTAGLVKGDGCGAGACAGGTVVCGASQTVLTCSTAALSSAESCDGNDNDCDGAADEDFVLNASCGVGNCTGGLTECNGDGSGTRCSTESGGSNDQSGAEVCDGNDNDCDGSTDEGDIADLCGSSVTATLECVGGQCGIDECITNQHDTDDDWSNGCECQDTNELVVDTCASPADFGTVDDSGATPLSYTANLPLLTDEDWYVVAFDDSSPAGPGDSFSAKVIFTSNPGSNFELEVFSDCTPTPMTCDGAGNSAEDRTEFTIRTDFVANQGTGSLIGESNCNVGSADTVQDGSLQFSQCDDDSFTAYIRVKYKDGISTPLCDNYSIEVSNGL